MKPGACETACPEARGGPKPRPKRAFTFTASSIVTSLPAGAIPRVNGHKERPMDTATTSTRGMIIESRNIPAGFGSFLERRGLAGMTARTVEGMYLEPRAPLTAILRAFEVTGAAVIGVRPSGKAPDWHVTARAAAGARMRLRNVRSAEWLPTLPPAA